MSGSMRRRPPKAQQSATSSEAKHPNTATQGIDRFFSPSFQITHTNRDEVHTGLKEYFSKARGGGGGREAKQVLSKNLSDQVHSELHQYMADHIKGKWLMEKDEKHATPLFYALINDEPLELIKRLSVGIEKTREHDRHCIGVMTLQRGMNWESNDSVSPLFLAAIFNKDWRSLEFLADKLGEHGIDDAIEQLRMWGHYSAYFILNGKKYDSDLCHHGLQRLLYFCKDLTTVSMRRTKDHITEVFKQANDVNHCRAIYAALAKNMDLEPYNDSFLFCFCKRRIYSSLTTCLMETVQATLIKLAKQGKGTVEELQNDPLFDPKHNRFGVNPCYYAELQRMINPYYKVDDDKILKKRG